MGFPKVIIVGTASLFVVIGASALVKKVFFSPEKKKVVVVPVIQPKPVTKIVLKPTPAAAEPAQQEGDFPKVDRIDQLFSTSGSKLPIVETISYSSNVPWHKGGPAWLGNYAGYYATSRHFIARSLNKKPDYFTFKVSSGDKFNVFRKDRNVQFHLLVDVSRLKMAFYYIDLDTNERVLLKTYLVGLGKKTEEGTLTPLGKYLLDDKIAVYGPGTMGLFQGKKVEMIQVFGTRWIPFGKDKGYGIHGAPWTPDKKTGKWVEARQTIGQYDSDGCIRLSKEDMEEIFSIVITKPTLIEIVKNFKEAKLPGVEVATPMK